MKWLCFSDRADIVDSHVSHFLTFLPELSLFAWQVLTGSLSKTGFIRVGEVRVSTRRREDGKRQKRKRSSRNLRNSKSMFIPKFITLTALTPNRRFSTSLLTPDLPFFFTSHFPQNPSRVNASLSSRSFHSISLLLFHILSPWVPLYLSHFGSVL